MDSLLPLAKKVGEKLKARKETVGVSESSTGGLISAVLLAVPGASAYFMGGAVVYTRPAGEAFLDRDQGKARRHPLLLRTVGDAGGRARARAAEHDLGSRRNRRVRPDRQFLRRSRRPHLRRRRRPQGQDRAHPAHGLERPCRQHARLRGRGAEADGRAAFLRPGSRSRREFPQFAQFPLVIRQSASKFGPRHICHGIDIDLHALPLGVDTVDCI